MKFFFIAKIYKVGINPCVKVPSRITDKMVASKGYIPIKGKIKDHSFRHNLVPVKNAEHRLYINGAMLKGSNAKVGEAVKFTIEQDFTPRKVPNYSIPKELKKKLHENDLFPKFKKLTPSRQKAILKYLNYLKTEDALSRNINKVIIELKEKTNENGNT